MCIIKLYKSSPAMDLSMPLNVISQQVILNLKTLAYLCRKHDCLGFVVA